MALQILMTTTGTQDPVVFNDLGQRTFDHPTTNFDLLTEFTVDEIRASGNIRTALLAAHITLTDQDGIPITADSELFLNTHRIRGVIVDNAAIADKHLLQYNSATGKLEYVSESSIGGVKSFPVVYTDEVSSGQLLYYVTTTQKTTDGWVTITQAPYAGTNEGTTITKIYLTTLFEGGGGTYDLRMVDITNGSTIIAQLLAQNNTSWQEKDLGTISNLPATRAIFELQIRINNAQDRSISMSYMDFIA